MKADTWPSTAVSCQMSAWATFGGEPPPKPASSRIPHARRRRATSA